MKIIFIVLIVIICFLIYYNINETFTNSQIDSETQEINQLFNDFNTTIYNKEKIDFYKKILDYIKNN